MPGMQLPSTGISFLALWRLTVYNAENRSAVVLAERLGMRLEGCLRQSQSMKGRWWDTLVYAVLKQEWRGE